MAKVFAPEFSTIPRLAPDSLRLTKPPHPDEGSAASGLPFDIPPALMTELLEAVKGAGVERMATCLLDMIIGQLWAEEMAVWRQWSRPAEGALEPSELRLGLETYRRLGGAVGITRQRLYTLMAGLTTGEQKTAARVFLHLVTPTGRRLRQTLSDLAAYTDLGEGELIPVLHKLAGPEYPILQITAAGDGASELSVYAISHELWAAAI
ncbi:MAG: hypothetical protein EXR62_12750 [Chloroflexi bacterium]|nr:hypothetical protein [Chloroflexota bacterium]